MEQTTDARLAEAIASREAMQRERDEAREAAASLLLDRGVGAVVSRAQLVERERDEVRAQLAALHAAASDMRRYYGRASDGVVERLDRTLADFATAAAEHDARVRAPVEAERDQLAAALVTLKKVATVFANAVPTADDMLIDVALQRMREAFDALPADLASRREARIRADERAKALRDDPIALAYGIADHEAAGPRVGEVYRRPDGGTMQVVEIKRGSWRWCVYRSETGEMHERVHNPSWTLADEAERGTR